MKRDQLGARTLIRTEISIKRVKGSLRDCVIILLEGAKVRLPHGWESYYTDELQALLKKHEASKEPYRFGDKPKK